MKDHSDSHSTILQAENSNIGELAVTTEVIGSSLISISDQMAAVLQRSAYSTVIREMLDFSTSLFTPDGRLIGQATRIPIHLNSMSAALTRILDREFPPDEWCTSDVVVMNDPHQGGQHLPDFLMFSPVFFGDELVGFSGALGHQLDIGGGAAGSYAGDSLDIYQEGLVLPPLKLFEQGNPNKSLFRVINANVREPEKTFGDIYAQRAALKVGESGIQRLCCRYSSKIFSDATQLLLGQSEQRMRKRISQIPDGHYSASDRLDDEGLGNGPIQIAATVSITGDMLKVDFTDSAPQTPGPINATLPATQSAVYYALIAVLDPYVPANSGCYSPVNIHAPSGLIVNARRPAAVVGRMAVCHRVVDVLLQALAPVLPDSVPACGYGMSNAVNLGGTRASGGQWVFHEVVPGGWGGGPGSPGPHGCSAHLHNVANTPVEVIEAEYPLRICRYELIQGSGGAGLYDGGDGIRREYEVCAEAVYLTLQCDRFQTSPPGVFHGKPGQSGRCVIQREDGSIEILSSKVTNVLLSRGDLILLETQGGGGYGQRAVE